MTTKEKIAVMQAFDEGKPVEVQYHKTGSWSILHTTPYWNWEAHDFRIKPQPKLRPYKDGKEFIEALSTHGTWISPKNAKETQGLVIMKFNDYGVLIVTDTLAWATVLYDVLLENYVWTKDNTPCGIIEE